MNFRDITFAHPWLLLLLLAVPVIAWLKGRRGQQAAFLYSSVQLVKSIIGFQRSAAGFILPKLRWLALILLIMGARRFVSSAPYTSSLGLTWARYASLPG